MWHIVTIYDFFFSSVLMTFRCKEKSTWPPSSGTTDWFPHVSGHQWWYSPPHGRGCWGCFPLQTGWWWRISRAPVPCSKYQTSRLCSPLHPHPAPLRQESTPYRWLYLSQQPLHPQWWPSLLRSGWSGRYLILTRWTMNQDASHAEYFFFPLTDRMKMLKLLNWSDFIYL